MSATMCTAVGGDVPGNFAARWTGLGWHKQHVPTADPDSLSDTLTGVSCTFASACMAVGIASCTNCDTVASAEQWNGTRWSAANPRNPDASNGNDYLSDVSCVTAKVCIAVGSKPGRDVVGEGNPLAERWSGTRWAVQPTRSFGPRTFPCRPYGCFDGVLSGIACTSATSCIAVGSVSYWTDPDRYTETTVALVARYS